MHRCLSEHASYAGRVPVEPERLRRDQALLAHEKVYAGQDGCASDPVLDVSITATCRTYPCSQQALQSRIAENQ